MDAVVSERRRPEGADTTSATGGVSSSLGIGFKLSERGVFYLTGLFLGYFPQFFAKNNTFFQNHCSFSSSFDY